MVCGLMPHQKVGCKNPVTQKIQPVAQRQNWHIVPQLQTKLRLQKLGNLPMPLQ